MSKEKDLERIGAEWLAMIMRPICQSILQEMGKATSPLHWSAETAGNQAFQTINDHLVDMFKQLLATAANLKNEPEPAWTEALLESTLADLQTQMNTRHG